ncbi:hypothetical protein [Pseudolabrys sp.]|uniref:hypothetical protein n=1 Tax=Pseudolabrys sp. TaxID=1960880 RepID=UPI003D1295C9
MKLSTVIQRIPTWYKSGRCYYIRSAPGRGKTTVFCEAPKILEKQFPGKSFGLVVISGPLLTPSDSVGYLVPKHLETHSESVYTDPFWFRTEEGKRLDQYDGGIIVVDEADKMDTDVKKVIGEAALSGRLGPHRLPKGWVVWMAGNRQKDRSGSTKELDHLINRRCELDIDDDVEGWTNWAIENGVSPIAISFANHYTHIVFSQDPPKEQGSWCTPRSFVMADQYLQGLAGGSGEVPCDPTTTEEISGMIGAGAAAQLMAHVKLDQEMPKYEKIIADPEKAKVPTKPDAQMLVCYNLAHRVDKDTVSKVVKYIERLPKEFSVTFANAACKRDPHLVSTPAIQKWCSENASLMAQLAR